MDHFAQVAAEVFKENDSSVATRSAGDGTAGMGGCAGLIEAGYGHAMLGVTGDGTQRF